MVMVRYMMYGAFAFKVFKLRGQEPVLTSPVRNLLTALCSFMATWIATK
jgi:hypothetical protein